MAGKAGIICFDSGGANQIAAYLKFNPGDYVYCLGGPAVSIFERELGVTRLIEMSQLVEKSDYLISGTGWESDFEWLAMKTMIEAKKKVIAFVDHWTNYQARFVRNGVTIHPNEVWVSDVDAEMLAKRVFEKTPVKLLKNYYIEDLTRKREYLKQTNLISHDTPPSRILYLCQPILDYERIYKSSIGIDEFQALDLLEKHISLFPNEDVLVRIRPHPSETAKKYESVTKRAGFELSKNAELILDLSWANRVVGIDSYAMYVSDQIGIDTFTVLNIHAQGMSIPVGNIKQMEALLLRNERRAD